MGKIITATIDAGSQYDLLDLYKKVDVVIDLLPKTRVEDDEIFDSK